MFSFVHISSYRSILAGTLLLLNAASAHALQPLATFIEGARSVSVDNREAALVAVEQKQEALLTLSRALPAVSVRGTYTRNQFAAEFPNPSGTPATLTIQPYDQVDLFLQVDAPLIDVATWTRYQAAQHGATAARLSAQATALDVEKQVARYYYTLVGAEALQLSAQRTLAAAQQNADLTRERREGGIATALDVERAQAEVERTRQSITDTELQAQLARRALLTLTGVTASGEVTPAEDDLHEEPPLETWEATPDERVPTLAVAAEQARIATLQARAAKLSLLPTLGSTFVERFTNATSFIGQPEYFTFSINLNWRLDVSSIVNIKAQSLLAQVAGIRQERARLAAHDQIFEAWQRVRAGLAKSRAARAQAKATELAAQFATERYANGAGTQLDLVQAQRDAFAAQIGRAQADADLAYARALLRLTSGVPLEKDVTK